MPRHKIILLIVLIITIPLLIWYGAKSGFNIEKFQVFIKNLGIFAPIVFILIYTIGPVFFVPITPLSVTGGILFGLLWGTIFTVIGATLGACAAFLVSRFLVKDLVDKISSGKLALIKRRVEEEGWKFIAISRITPVFPFNVQNYIFGATNISLRTFFFATIISIIPGSFTYVYLGYAGREILGGGPEATIQVAIAVTLLFLFSLSPYLLKKIKQIRRKNSDKSNYCVKF